MLMKLMGLPKCYQRICPTITRGDGENEREKNATHYLNGQQSVLLYF